MSPARGWALPAVGAVFLAAVVFALVGRTTAPPLPAGTSDCIGLPGAVCTQHLGELAAQAAQHGGVSGYRFVCTTPTCDSASGRGHEVVVFGDGTSINGYFGYTVPLEAPTMPPGGQPTEAPLPVAPACRDVPRGPCEEAARRALSNDHSGRTPASITVWCATTCTEANGDVSVRVDFTDGTTLLSEANFGYRS